jgi:excinuclease ABC subunit C
MKIITIDKKTPKEIHAILNNAEQEALNFLHNSEKKNNLNFQSAEKIQNIFKLSRQPFSINAFDNTNFSGDFSTGVCVHWEGGRFIKNQYRRYNFKELKNGSDDFSMMKEMLERRIKEIIKNNIRIDLFLIDGGKMQRSALLYALSQVNFFYADFEIDFICIAKGENRNSRNETFFTKNQDNIKLDIYGEEIKLLQQIRDEAHRFASVQLEQKMDKKFQIKT